MITTNAGAGTLAVHIEGSSKLAIVCTELDDGYEFTYTPMQPGKYMIVIKYCSVTIAGCPFKAVVTGTGISTSLSSLWMTQPSSKWVTQLSSLWVTKLSSLW